MHAESRQLLRHESLRSCQHQPAIVQEHVSRHGPIVLANHIVPSTLSYIYVARPCTTSHNYQDPFTACSTGRIPVHGQ